VRSFAAQDVVGAEHRGERPGLGAPAGRAGLGAAPAPAAPGDARRGLGAEAGPGPGAGGGGAAGGLGFRAAGGAAAPADEDAEDNVVLPTEFGRMCGPKLIVHRGASSCLAQWQKVLALLCGSRL